MTLDVVTFGCRLNTLESEVMQMRAREAGLDDAVLVNTCAVTSEAVRQARQTIRRLRRERPASRIVVAGCAAQIDPASFADMAEVDLVLGNAEKLDAKAYRLPDFGIPLENKAKVADIAEVRETAGHLVAGMDGHTRAFVEIQNGCDHRCTFCVIPYGRGPSRSVPMGAVVEQIRRLVAGGHGEIVLTGVDITAYGADLPGQPTLGTLVAKILKLLPELPRLRLSSLDTIEVDAALLRVIGEEARLMPHFHLSLQSGDDMILKRMKRRHSRAEALAFCESVRQLRPDAVFGADLIAGFPTESEAMFENSLRLPEDAGLTYLHVFPFSPRPDTPAARMPPLAKLQVKERAARLRAEGERRLGDFLDGEVGQIRSVLMERGGTGRTEHFAPVRLGGVPAGDILAVRISARSGGELTASPIEKAA
jgi:threonylcarbamoyladenosine tRNA methylthiotransferase MtaB